MPPPQVITAMKPSMKVPPKRKGNGLQVDAAGREYVALNESPSEKEGKSTHSQGTQGVGGPSMKVPPKRKGNKYTGNDTLSRENSPQ